VTKLKTRIIVLHECVNCTLRRIETQDGSAHSKGSLRTDTKGTYITDSLSLQVKPKQKGNPVFEFSYTVNG
jgi:hypothetical protein